MPKISNEFKVRLISISFFIEEHSEKIRFANESEIRNYLATEYIFYTLKDCLLSNDTSACEIIKTVNRLFKNINFEKLQDIEHHLINIVTEKKSVELYKAALEALEKLLERNFLIDCKDSYSPFEEAKNVFRGYWMFFSTLRAVTNTTNKEILTEFSIEAKQQLLDMLKITNLSLVDLSYLDLSNVEMKLLNPNFIGVNNIVSFEGSDLSGLDFSNKNFSNVNFNNSTLINSCLINSDFTNASFDCAEFIGMNESSLTPDFSNSILEGATFKKSDFNEAKE